MSEKKTKPMWAICLDYGKNLHRFGAEDLNKRIRMCMPFLRSHEEHSMILGAQGELTYFWFFLDKAVRDGVLRESMENETLKDAFEVYGIDCPANIPSELVNRLYGKELSFRKDA